MGAITSSTFAEARSAPFTNPHAFLARKKHCRWSNQKGKTPEHLDVFRQCFLAALSSVTGAPQEPSASSRAWSSSSPAAWRTSHIEFQDLAERSEAAGWRPQ